MEIKDGYGAFPEDIKGSFHHLLRKRGLLCFYTDEPDVKNEEVYANFEFSVFGQKGSAILLESHVPIINSVDYDENLLLQEATLGDKEISMWIRTDFNYAEQIVSLTKRLHERAYPDALGKWIFARIHLHCETNPRQFKNRKLKIRAGRAFFYRLTQNSIWLDKNPIGEIWFSLAGKVER
jgi:hypothetical protein